MSTAWKQKPNSEPFDTALPAELHSVILAGRQKPLESSVLNPRCDLEADQSNRKSRISPFVILLLDANNDIDGLLIWVRYDY